MSRSFLAFSLALCAPCAALAAPAPPARLVTAEAVLRPPRGNPRDLAARLASAPFLAGVTKSRPPGWLASRLKAVVDADRGTVTLRLTDCPRKDAVALLGAVVEAYKAEFMGQVVTTAKLREREVLVRFLIVRQLNANAQAGVNGAIQLNESNAEMVEAGPTKTEVDASVLQPPRVVQPGLPGRQGPAR
jgi:hypothetical protein